MAYCEIAFRVEAPADRVWDIIGWLGAKRLVGVEGLFFDNIKIAPERVEVGSIRTLHMPDQPPVSEQLTSHDEAARAYEYRVVDAGALPATNYRGRVAVTAAGSGACHLSWRCWCDPVGVSDDEWTEMYYSIETALAGAIAGLAGARDTTGEH